MNQGFSDRLVRGVAQVLGVRFSACVMTTTVEFGIRIHDCDPVSADCFGRALVVSGLMIPLLKGNQKHTLRWQYQGRLGRMTVEGDARGRVRGIPQCTRLVTCEDLRALYGDSGLVSVVRACTDTGKILNQGSSEAGILEVGDDMGFLLSVSDQTETEIMTELVFRADPSCPVEYAGGVLLQAMPGSDLLKFEVLRHALKERRWRDALVSGGTDLAGVLGAFFREHGETGEVVCVEDMPPSYSCNCDRSRVLEAAISLARKDLEELLLERELIPLTCHFCRKTYNLSKQDLN